MKILFCLLFLSCCFFTCYGQVSEKQKVIGELKSVSEHYRNKKYLSFDIRYKYANEQQPAVYLDTLSGSFKISGNQYWYSLANTEAIGNNEYMILLFKEDKIMYLTKPSSFSLGQNPIALIDSFLSNNDNINYTISNINKQKQIVLDFGEGLKYKRIEYDIEAASGLISKMICIVRASELYDPSVKSLVDSDNTYAIIEANFTNYKEIGFNSDLFDIAKYFKKQGEEFIALPPYETYKVFLGTTQLY
jgi:hypothetical protein